MFSDLIKATSGDANLESDLAMHYLLNKNADESFGTKSPSTVGTPTYSGDKMKIVGTQYIQTDHFLTASENVDLPFSVSVWYEALGTPTTNGSSSTANVHGIVGAGPSNSDWAFGIRMDPTTDYVYVQLVDRATGDGSFHLYGPSGVDLGFGSGMHNYVVTYDGSETFTTTSLRFYVDGVELVNPTLSPRGTYTGMRHDELNIGCVMPTSTTWRYGSNGNFSNFRVYDTQINQSMVTALYAEGYYPKPLTPPPSDMLAYFPLTGSHEDWLGNYDGTDQGSTFIDEAEFGAVSDFNSSTDADYINVVKVPTGTGDFSISGWIKKHESGDGWIVNNRSSSGTPGSEWQLYFYSSSGSLLFSLVNSLDVHTSVTFPSIPKATHTRWYHFCLTVSGTTITSYADGSYDNSSTFVGTRVNTSTTTRIGTAGWSTATSLAYDGNLGDLRFYSRALSATEVSDIHVYEKNFRAVDIDDGLSAYYPLKESSKDNYWREKNCTDTAMTYNGTSAVFNGSTSGVKIPAGLISGTNSSGTLVAWVKVDVIPTVDSGRIVFPGFADFTMNVTTAGKINASHWSPSFSGTINSASISLATWYHAAATWDGSTLTLHIDGEFVDDLAIGGPPSAYTGVGGIGYNGTSTSRYLDGNIAHVRIYNKPLLTEQIEAIYNSEKGDFI